MLLRLSMPRSPIRFLSCAILALTYVWRSLAYLYSAFSERSPWARATAISLGSSTLSSCSSWAISSCSFCFTFAIGSDMRLHQTGLRVSGVVLLARRNKLFLPPWYKKFRGEDFKSRPRAASSIDASKLNEQEQSFGARGRLADGNRDLPGDGLA